MMWNYICFHNIAVCPGCDSNHICTAPNTCVCPTGWTGNDCHTGMQTLHVCVNTELYGLLSLLLPNSQISTNVSKTLLAVNVTAQILTVATAAHVEVDTHLQLIFTTA